MTSPQLPSPSTSSPRRAKSTRRSWRPPLWWLITTAAAAAILVAALAFREQRPSPTDSSLSAGTCLIASIDADGRARHRIVSCETDGSFSVVNSTSDNQSCGPHLSILTLADAASEKSTSKDVKKTVCLIPNLTQGRCYGQVPASSYPAQAGPTALPCTDRLAEYRVLQRLDHVGSASACPDTSNDSIVADAADFKRTYCLVAPR